MDIKLRLTTYWPYTANVLEKLMEGDPTEAAGFAGRAGRSPQALNTVEDFLAGRSDFVSLSGDWKAFPFGQKITIPWGDQTLVGRVVDTGGHFTGAGKVYRDAGYEPIDVCVYSSDTKPPDVKVVGTIEDGDSFESGRSIDYAKLVSTESEKVASDGGKTVLIGLVLGIVFLGLIASV